MLFNPEDVYEVEVRGETFIILRERDIHAVAAERLEERPHRSVPLTNQLGRVGEPHARTMAPCPSPVATPIEVREADLDRVKYNDDGLVAAIVQDVEHPGGADDGLDERRDAADEPGAGPHGVLVPLPQRGVAQGRHVGRPPVHPLRPTYDCDGDTLLFLVEQEGNGRLSHRVYTCFFRPFGSDDETTARPARPEHAVPDRETFTKLARTTGSCRCGTRCWPT